MIKVAHFIMMNCKCGEHLIDLNNAIWDENDSVQYMCNSCYTPLIIKGDNGHLYLVGERIK